MVKDKGRLRGEEPARVLLTAAQSGSEKTLGEEGARGSVILVVLFAVAARWRVGLCENESKRELAGTAVGCTMCLELKEFECRTETST